MSDGMSTTRNLFMQTPMRIESCTTEHKDLYVKCELVAWRLDRSSVCRRYDAGACPPASAPTPFQARLLVPQEGRRWPAVADTCAASQSSQSTRPTIDPSLVEGSWSGLHERRSLLSGDYKPCSVVSACA
eukprot:6211165-Pleurochrysis_carterae.AAC.2